MKRFALLLVVYPCLAADPCPDTTPGAGGLRNQIRIVVNLADGSPVATNLAPITDFVKSESTVAGDVVLTSLLWGKITVSPTCSGTRASISQRAPAIEIRPQVLSVSLLDASTLELRIEEHWEDFDGKWPSSGWQSRYLNSFTQLSHAK